MPATDAVSPTPFNFRQCLWLCLPALIVGAILRISFLVAVPQVYYGSDSNSYFTTADGLWNHGEFKIPPKRRYLYPVFLAAVVALPGSTAVGVAILQHAAGLATLLGIGWVAGQLTRRPAIWVPAVTLVAAMWPRMLWYEHEMIAEVFILAALVLTVALALPLERLRTRRGLLFFLIAAGVVIAVKPHGRPFWLAFVFLAGVYTWGHLRWKVEHWAVVAASIFILITGGSNSQGSWLLLSSALPLVKTEGAKWQEYRTILKPMIEEARADLVNYAVLQGRYKKELSKDAAGSQFGPEWATLRLDKTKFATVAKHLAIEGILAQPLVFTEMLYRKIMCVLAYGSPRSSITPARFWEQQAETNEGRWTRNGPQTWLVYGMDEAAYLRMEEAGRARTLWFDDTILSLEKEAAWTAYINGRPGQPPRISLRWPGVLLTLGLLTCLLPGRFRRTAILWLPVIVYCGLIFTVGDTVTRYLHPIDWAAFVLVALGLDAVLDAGAWLWRKVTAQPALAVA